MTEDPNVKICHVRNERCDWNAHRKCFGCGLPVCESCSRMRPWYRWKRKRICDDCHQEMERGKR